MDMLYVYTRVKKNQLNAQLILRIFRQPLHVSSAGWIVTIQPGQQTVI